MNSYKFIPSLSSKTAENIVEKIVSRREHAGKVPDSETSWVRVEDLDEQRTKYKASTNSNSSGEAEKLPKKKSDHAKPSGSKKKHQDFNKNSKLNSFDKGLEAEHIWGLCQLEGIPHFFIQFKGIDKAEFVPASVANVKAPQLVIKFYQTRLDWHSDYED